MKDALSPTLRLALLLAAFGIGPFGCDSSEACREDGGPDSVMHLSAFVTLSDGTRLHYLDFGGTGMPLVFLAGAGCSAHVFDDFAPRFVDWFRVLALTRRGFGESSHPQDGYATSRLSDDIAGWMTAIGLSRAYVAGHSVAGAEMVQLANTHTALVEGLVFLDAAYDWAAAQDELALATAPVQPNPTTDQMSSPEAFAGYIAWANGLSSYPVPDVRATSTFTCQGRYAGSKTSSSIMTEVALGAAATHPDYAGIASPVLALYTVAERAVDMFPWLSGPDSSQAAQAEAYFPLAQSSLAHQRAAFVAALPKAKVIEMVKTPHFLFLAEPETVVRHMREFFGRRLQLVRQQP